MKKKFQTILIAVVLIIAFTMAINPSMFTNLGLSSIVGVSSITFDDKTNYWVIPMVVDSDGESIILYKNDLQSKLPTGSTVGANSIKLVFSPQEPTCSYTTNTASYAMSIPALNFDIPDLYYWKIGQGRMNAKYNVELWKNGQKISTTPLQAGSDAQQKVYLDNGNVEINNFGIQWQGVACPQEAVLYYDEAKKQNKLLDKSQFDNWAKGIQDCFASITILEAPLIATCSIPYIPCQSATWNRCANTINNPPQPASTFVGIKDFSKPNSQLIAIVPTSWGTANTTVRVSTALADAVVYSPPKGEPLITDLHLEPSAVKKTQTSRMYITIKNIGTTQDSFKITSYSKKGFMGFNPSSFTLNIKNNETGSDSRTIITTTNAGTDSACVLVQAIGSGKTAPEKCVDLPIEEVAGVPSPIPIPPIPPVPIPPVAVDCGNGKCEPEKGENYTTCIPDCCIGCGIIPPIPTPKCVKDSDCAYQMKCVNGGCVSTLPVAQCSEISADGFFVLKWVEKTTETSTPPTLFGFIPLPFVPATVTTEKVCVPQYNLGLITIIALIIIGIVVVSFFGLKGKKKRRR